MNGQDEWIDKIACLTAMNKTLMDTLLDVIELGCFEHKFASTQFGDEDAKTLSDLVKTNCGVAIQPFVFNIWLNQYFTIDGGHLVRKENVGKGRQRIDEECALEDNFQRNIDRVCDMFIAFCKSSFNVNIDKERAKAIFDKYTYSVSRDSNVDTDKDLQNRDAFMFRQFMRHLVDTDTQSLDVIESFGVANQIRSFVVNDDTLSNRDEHFLKGCRLFIDTTPMMRRLGYNGKLMSQSYKEFFDSMKKAGAELCMFKHTFDELYGIVFTFKLNIVQNNFGAPGVDKFLKARKEIKGGLPLEEDAIKQKINDLEINILSSYNEEDNEKPHWLEWDFDKEKFSLLIEKEFRMPSAGNRSMAEDKRLQRDVTSVEAVHRLRRKDGIDDTANGTTYKTAKYFLLVSNYALAKAVKSYYASQEVRRSPNKNELMLESTVLFDLWQNVEDNPNLNRSLFRSKCLAVSGIDQNFKTALYNQAKRLSVYKHELNIESRFIDDPNYTDTLYEQSIRDDNDEISRKDKSELDKYVNELLQRSDSEVERIKKHAQEQEAQNRSQADMLDNKDALLKKSEADREEEKNRNSERSKQDAQEIANLKSKIDQLEHHEAEEQLRKAHMSYIFLRKLLNKLHIKQFDEERYLEDLLANEQ